MTSAARTAGQRRFLALWFPFLPTDRLVRARPCAAPDDGPLVLVERQRGAMRLTAGDAAAAALGLTPGMTLADARAQVPGVVVADADPPADQRWLEHIADACDCFTPLVQDDPPGGLILDMTGCLHFHTDEAALMAAVTARMRRWTDGLRLAMASSPEGARALARHQNMLARHQNMLARHQNMLARHQNAPACDEAAALRRLPVAALEMAAEVEHALRRAGLKTIGDLAGRPSAPLAARFGTALVDRRDRLLGHSDSRLTPRRAPPALLFERCFADPIATADAAMAVIGALAENAAAVLEERRRGGRQFVARLYRTDGHVASLSIESGVPLRDPARIRRLFEEQVGALSDPIDPGFGFDMIRLAVPRDEPLAAAQLALEGGAMQEEALAALIDRLSARHGRDRVRRFAPRDTHIPEQTVLALPAIAAPAVTAWPMPEDGEPPLRPIHMFDPPQPVEVIAGVADGPPQRFRWRRTLYDVARAEGPERISNTWWRRPPKNGTKDQDAARDYYRVEDMRGRRLWLFRHDDGDTGAPPRWYVHGLFA